MPATGGHPPDRAAQLALQQAHVEVLDSKLSRAERAVGQARTPAAAAAHRRADALLLEVEAAEDALRLLKHTTDRPRPTRVRSRTAAPPDQERLFDIG